jgi:hypothetical protein
MGNKTRVFLAILGSFLMRKVGSREVFLGFGLWCLFEGARQVYPPAGWLSVGVVVTGFVLRRPMPPTAKMDEVVGEIMAALGRRNA